MQNLSQLCAFREEMKRATVLPLVLGVAIALSPLILRTPTLLLLVIIGAGAAYKFFGYHPLTSTPEKWSQNTYHHILLTLFALASIATLSVTHILSNPSFHSLTTNYCLYLTILSIYHLGEFYFVLYYHPDELSWESFLIYHSREYQIATIFAQAEFFLECWLASSAKLALNAPVLMVAVPLALGGLALRNLAFHQAKSNFHHLVRYGRDPKHCLVTTGVYSFDRHPSYLGYFVMTIALQAILKNPITSLLFPIVLYRFFSRRIHEEEETLVSFFGREYELYRKAVPCRIPGVQKYLDTAD